MTTDSEECVKHKYVDFQPSQSAFNWTKLVATAATYESMLTFGQWWLFCDYSFLLRERIVLKCVPHVQHDYFSSFNQSDHCFLASSLPFPCPCLSSLKTLKTSASQSLSRSNNNFMYNNFIWPLSTCFRSNFVFLEGWPRFIRELKQPRRRRQQKPHKFAYLTMKNRIFARFARAFFIFWHFEDVLVLSTTWNDLFCSCVDDVSIWWQMFNFVSLCPKRWFQINSRTVRGHWA